MVRATFESRRPGALGGAGAIASAREMRIPIKRLTVPAAILAGAVALRVIGGRRLRQLRHALRARLGRTALARLDPRLRGPDRAHAPPAGRAARRRARAARSARRAGGDGRAGVPGAVGVRVGDLRAGGALVRTRRRGARRAGCCSRACPCCPTACARTSTSRTCCSCSARCWSSPATDRETDPIGQHRRPVLALLALAGLLRPEAWVFSGLYWLYLIAWPAYRRRQRLGSARAGVARRPLRGRRTGGRRGTPTHGRPLRALPARARRSDAARCRRAAGVDGQRPCRSPAIRCGR